MTDAAVELTGDDKPLQATLNHAEALLTAWVQKIESKSRQIFGQNAGNFIGGVTAGVSAAAFNSLSNGITNVFQSLERVVSNTVRGFWDLIKEGTQIAKAQEISLMKLRAIAAASGNTSGQSIAEIRADAIRRSLMVGFSPMENIDARTAFMRSNLNRGQTQMAMELATDFALAYNKTLRDSAGLIARVLNNPDRAQQVLRRFNLPRTAQEDQQIRALMKAGDRNAAMQMELDILRRGIGPTSGIFPFTQQGMERRAVAELNQFKAMLADVFGGEQAAKNVSQAWIELGRVGQSLVEVLQGIVQGFTGVTSTGKELNNFLIDWGERIRFIAGLLPQGTLGKTIGATALAQIPGGVTAAAGVSTATSFWSGFIDYLRGFTAEGLESMDRAKREKRRRDFAADIGENQKAAAERTAGAIGLAGAFESLEATYRRISTAAARDPVVDALESVGQKLDTSNTQQESQTDELSQINQNTADMLAAMENLPKAGELANG